MSVPIESQEREREREIDEVPIVSSVYSIPYGFFFTFLSFFPVNRQKKKLDKLN